MSAVRKNGEAKRRARPVTADYLFRAAVHYLERYASSSGNLRRVLERKAARRLREADDGDGEPPDVIALIDETLARLLELKLIDDAEFARARVASLRRRGASRRQTAAKLAEKGVERETAEAAMAADETDEREAALAYARRRRLGPHRAREREERRDRDVAAMMRAGFSYADAAFAVDGDRPAH
ncbi:regulatory protein RecX [Aureimonas mangrovi]|uniref:regulatory protein RecX n=1 Tax=Aureimonas mangrovi TaxID=2758041 RepID=UPI00163D5CF5|nr:RecX family transcriptional regulator [Aureimonas mangrovi]